MVNVKDRQNDEEVEKIAELYIKLEKLQGYLRKVQGRIRKAEGDLTGLRKKREEKEEEMIQGIKKKDYKVSKLTI